ncbi:MAG TPA: DUF3857 domain-containing protein, partial [Pyrinomonadaceae bacterium]|nr:DUF3857 domain-containing protein [Pyrinomonadaceae bacterium]
MRRIFFILIAVCLFAASSEGQRKRPRAAAPKISPPVVKARAESKNAGVSVERYVVDYVVNPDKTSLETTEILQRLTSPVMIARMSKISFLFNADLEEVKILDAYKISGGRRETISRDKIEIKLTPQAEAAPAFSSYKAASIDFGALKTGDAIYYKVQTFNKKAFFEGHFSVAEFFSTLFEWKSVEINLSAPVDYALNVEAVDLEGGRLEDLDKRARWQWRRANIPPRDYHPGIKSLVDTNPRLVVTSFKNYEELGRAYWTEAENKTTVTPEIQNLADEITKNLPERKEQAAAIYEWVNKNIRYLSIVLERGGWIPHSADSILKNGYGDCKDYVTILQALLKAKKIESEPVLINAEGLYWFPKIAPTAIFNHAILYVPELNVFADATAPNTRLGLLPSSLLGKSGILAGGRNGKITIPEGKPEDCRFLSDSEITFDAGGNLKSASKNLYVGRAEMFFRPMFADSRIIEDGGDFMKILLAVYGIDGTGKINEISNPHRLADPFTIRLEANIDNYTTFLPKGAVTIPQGLNLVNTAMLESLVRENKMKSELQVGATVFRENFKLKFPANVSITALAPNTKFTSEVGSFSAEYKLENNHVVVTRELIIAKDAVKPGEYAKFKELIEKAVEENNAVIGYQSQTDILREKFNNRKPAAANKKTNKEESLLESLIRPAAILKKLTPRQAVEIEKRIEQTPDDVQLRRRILKYYYEPPRAEAKIKAAIPHRVWLIQNFPDQND